MAITLRTLADSDLDALFVWESDPRAVEMAAFTRADPSDRGEFEAHYERVRDDHSNRLLAIDDDGQFVGTIPKRRSRQESAPRSSSASIDSITNSDRSNFGEPLDSDLVGPAAGPAGS